MGDVEISQEASLYDLKLQISLLPQVSIKLCNESAKCLNYVFLHTAHLTQSHGGLQFFFWVRSDVSL